MDKCLALLSNHQGWGVLEPTGPGESVKSFGGQPETFYPETVFNYAIIARAANGKCRGTASSGFWSGPLFFTELEKDRGWGRVETGGERARRRWRWNESGEREKENSNSKILFYKDRSLGSAKTLSNN